MGWWWLLFFTIKLMLWVIWVTIYCFFRLFNWLEQRSFMCYCFYTFFMFVVVGFFNCWFFLYRYVWYALFSSSNSILWTFPFPLSPNNAKYKSRFLTLFWFYTNFISWTFVMTIGWFFYSMWSIVWFLWRTWSLLKDKFCF